MKFVVTTRREVLEDLKQEGWYLIGVDGTVPNSHGLYDELYDHHRPNGADIQLDEMTEYSQSRECFGTYGKPIAVITTSVDADAIVSAYRLMDEYAHLDQEQINLLRAIAYDCDHLAVPADLSKYADQAAQVVAALKEEANRLAKKLNLPVDRRRQWNVEDKEKFGSLAFEEGVKLISKLLRGEWEYRWTANKYWQGVKKITQQIKAEKRISRYRNHLMVVGSVDM